MPKASKVKKKVSKAKTVNKTKSKSLSKTKNTQKNPIKISNAYIPKEIAIRVNVPSSKGETMVFEANCSSDDAIQLAAGTLDSSEFMQKIDLQTS